MEAVVSGDARCSLSPLLSSLTHAARPNDRPSTGLLPAFAQDIACLPAAPHFALRLAVTCCALLCCSALPQYHPTPTVNTLPLSPSP